MYTGSRGSRHGSYVDNEISYLTIKVVGVGVPIDTLVVGVGIDDGDTLKAGCCFECGNTEGIADELSIVILNEWRANEVCSRRKVDESWGNSTGVTAFTAAITVADGGINCCGVICSAVSGCAVVVNITEDFER